MDKKEIFKHFSNILDEMIETEDFYKIYFQSPYSLEDDMEVSPSITLRTGISRACLVDSNFDYVVKISFNLQDECEREIDIYRDAKDYGVEKFFAQPTYLGSYCKNIIFYDIADVERDHEWYDLDSFYQALEETEQEYEVKDISIVLELYAYPRANTYFYNHYSDEAESYALESKSPLKEYNLAIAASFINDYGIDDYNELTNFLYEWGIADIHFGNTGELNHHICIIDYAGVGDY